MCDRLGRRQLAEVFWDNHPGFRVKANEQFELKEELHEELVAAIGFFLERVIGVERLAQVKIEPNSDNEGSVFIRPLDSEDGDGRRKIWDIFPLRSGYLEIDSAVGLDSAIRGVGVGIATYVFPLLSFPKSKFITKTEPSEAGERMNAVAVWDRLIDLGVAGPYESPAESHVWARSTDLSFLPEYAAYLITTWIEGRDL